jgi:hypothetical protein
MSIDSLHPSSDARQMSSLARPYKPGDFKAHLTRAIDLTGSSGVRIGDWTALVHVSGSTTTVLNIAVKRSPPPDQVLPAGTEVVCLLNGGEL